MKTKKLIIFLVFAIVAIGILLLAINVFQISSSNTVSDATLNNVGYLGDSKLFLVSANVSYGVYSANASWSGGTFDDQDCFVITATIRNDYTLEELQSFWSYGVHSGRVYFGASATLYEKGSSEVLANDVTGAICGSISHHLGVPQWYVCCGETGTVEMYLAINNKNIDSYTINIIMLELSGLPIP
jgi:hypothetical protein